MKKAVYYETLTKYLKVLYKVIILEISYKYEYL